MARRKAAAAIEPTQLRKLDLGCGPHKREGFEGVDATSFVGVDHVVDLKVTPWPWADNSVSEAHCSHFLEHLTAMERVAFCNELYRVLVPNGTCQIIVPHWASCRAYGDPTHQWPPVSEFWFLYLEKSWRASNAPHTDADYVPGMFNCNFNWSYGYNINPNLATRHEEYKAAAIQNHKEAIWDFVATITTSKG